MLSGKSGILALLLVVAGYSIWFLFARHTPGTQIRNVVLISIDTCRADHLSCYGYERKTTPNIDAVANEGVLFTRVHSTNPITLPAHSSMLTGTNPPYHGVHDNHSYRLGDANVSLAEIMRDHGYQTAAFVSAFVLDAKFGLDQGFGTYDDPVLEEMKKLYINERKAGDTSRQAVAWLDNHGHEPFFLFLHYFDPHREYEPPEPYASRFPETPYAGEIAYTDHCIGQVIQKLKSLGIYDSTLLLITSDHGESLGEHEEDTHAYFIYQSTIRVPFIIKTPGCAAQRKLDGPVGIVDVVPTVLGLVGIPQPPEIQGEDLSRLLFDKGEPGQRYLYCESLWPTKYDCNGLFGLIHDRWKYIWTTRPELYDLVRDPAEATNLIDKEPEVAGDLQAQLQKMLVQRARTDVADGMQKLDRQSVERLRSLGYVGGAVRATSLEVDPDGLDPKEFIDHHKLLIKARAHFAKGLLEEARLKCLEILQKRPRDLGTLQLLGGIALEDGRNADAVSAYSRYLVAAAEATDSSSQRTVVQMNSDNAHAHYNLGNALQRLGRSEDSLAHYQEVLRLEPDYTEAHYNLGNALQIVGRSEDSLGHYQEALRLKPDYAEAHYHFGDALQSLGRFEDSLGHYQEALRLEPKLIGAHNNLGNALQRLGRSEDSLAHYREALRLKPDYAQAHYNWGKALEDIGRFEEAVTHYQHALRIEPNVAEPHNDWGNALMALGRSEEAVAHYQHAVRIMPDYAEAHNNLGLAMQGLGRLEEAVANYQDALRIKPDFAEAHFNLGNALSALGRVEEAVSHYQKGLQLKPNRLVALNNLAWLLATCSRDKVRDGREAVKLAERAARLTAYKNPAILDTLSAAHAEAGNLEEAVRWVEKAVQMAPEKQKDVLRGRLELYQQGKPYREKPKGNSLK